MNRTFVLASGSPRRREALEKMGLDFTVNVSNVTEDIEPSWSPEQAVVELAKRKALAVSAELPTSDQLVIGCDTVIDLDGAIVGKADDEEGMVKTLSSLRGRTHRVLSGLAVVEPATNVIETDFVVTHVTMREFSDSEMSDYIRTGEPAGKAGSYAIQGKGRDLVSSYVGDIENVIGMPTVNLKELLARFGALE